MSSPKPLEPLAMESSEKSAKEIEDSIMMPPPPNPTVKPKIILEAELDGLLDAMKNAVAQTGMVYKFYATSRKHGISHVQPPQSITAALGREIERYDQICDSLEAHILRALAVVQRDLEVEKQRIEEQERALKAKEAEETKSTTTPVGGASGTQGLKTDATLQVLPNSSAVSSSSISGRRPSAVSISSLHRPSLPGKLDLSSASFRLSSVEESSIFQSGLASPVMLAPRSARALGPNELGSDFLSAFGSTSSDATGMDIIMHNPSHDDISVGDSSDKPGELGVETEIDMAELFGEDPDSAGPAQEGVSTSNDLFSPHLVDGTSGPSDSHHANFLTDSQNDNILSALAAAGNPNPTEIPGIPKEGVATMPSPGSLLTNFPSPANPETTGAGSHEQFMNFDNLEFFSDPQAQPPPDMNFIMDYNMGNETQDPNTTKGSTNYVNQAG